MADMEGQAPNDPNDQAEPVPGPQESEAPHGSDTPPNGVVPPEPVPHEDSELRVTTRPTARRRPGNRAKKRWRVGLLSRRAEEPIVPTSGGHAVPWRPPSQIRRGDMMRGEMASLQLHVGVNLLWLRPGEVGGSEEYITRLLGAVDSVAPPGLRITLFVLPSFIEAHPRLTARYPVVVAPTSGRHRSWRVLTESTWLVSEASKVGVDLFHYAGGTAPLSGPRGVLHLYDLQYLTYPQSFKPVKLRWLRYVMPRSVKRSLMVCCPSEFVKSTIIEGLQAPPDDIVVVPHVMGRIEQASQDVRARYGLKRPFFLYPAITYMHKNHSTLIRALAKVPDVDLVLTGGEGPMEAEVQAEIERAGVRDRVVRTGRVSAADLTGLYREATALTFPSRYEGFGNPVVEAMQLGLPVLASQAGSLPEVVGGAGLLLDPDDVEAWAGAMAMTLGDEAARSWMVAAGRARASGFNSRSAAEVLIGTWVQAAAAKAALASQ